MHYPAADLVIDPVLIRQYDVSGPRYTSYPTADRFVEAFGETELRQWLAKRSIGGVGQPLSLYVHLPFCDTLCYYCGCNKVVTRDHTKSSKYIKYLEKELALLDPALGNVREISQMHWGGGTPTFLSHEEMRALVAAIDRHFRRAPDCESAIEVDPRSAAPGTLELLAALGFNRVSLGVQDFDPQVQKAVHRLQSEEETRRVVGEARASGFRSVNIDLIYGLPRQTLDGFNRTLDRVIELDPDRIALYSYAHLPKVFMPQRRIAEADLPSAEAKLQILSLAIGRLTRAGYLYIGMDHFARPDDELALAQSQGRLQRNFQGYSTHGGCDLIGLGVSSISSIGNVYAQNAVTTMEYETLIEDGHLPIRKGIAVDDDDLLRADVIQALMCYDRLDFDDFDASHGIDFRNYFKSELERMQPLAQDDLIELEADGINITAKGRRLLRCIAMVFDRHMAEIDTDKRFSRAI